MITLYSRQHCPLCEEMERLLLISQIKYDYVDIDDDKSLLQKYHTSVPVLKNNNEQILMWPCTVDDIKTFVDQ